MTEHELESAESCEHELESVESWAMLFADIAGGSQRAFEELYDRFSPLVVAKAVARFRNRIDADAVANEVWHKVWERRHELSDLKSFPAWLCTVTSNTATDLQRKGRVREEHSLSSVDPVDPHLPIEVFVLLDSLPCEQANVVRLIDLCSFTCRQAASSLGLSKSAVNRIHQQALVRLRGAVEESPRNRPR